MAQKMRLSKDSHCKVVFHASAASSFAHPDLYASALVSANTCFLCVPNPEEGTPTRKQTEFLCALLSTASSVLEFLSDPRKPENCGL